MIMICLAVWQDSLLYISSYRSYPFDEHRHTSTSSTNGFRNCFRIWFIDPLHSDGDVQDIAGSLVAGLHRYRDTYCYGQRKEQSENVTMVHLLPTKGTQHPGDKVITCIRVLARVIKRKSRLHRWQ